MADISLLLHDPHVSADACADTLFGGAPSVDKGFTWPVCATCHGNMMFLGQIRAPHAERLLLVFMCGNDPGLCEEWDANAGGNAVRAVPIDGLRLADVPAEGKTTRPRYGARVDPVTADGYDAARSIWSERHDDHSRIGLGQLGGAPEWLQGDETPSCDACERPMTLAAQLESGPDAATEMNFGGGCGYVFDCTCSAGTSKFLWQS